VVLKAEVDKKEQEKQKKIEQERIKKEKEEQKRQEEAEQKEKEREEKLTKANPNKTGETAAPKEPTDVPDGKEDVPVNDNIPRFSNEDISDTEVYHKNGPFDSLGRVTEANAVIGVEIMPAEERGSIGHIEPSGWNQARYANIGAGGWLYNRSHLIAHQLTGVDEPENIMTGTRWFNEEMIAFENFIAFFVEDTDQHVRFRVSPVFKENNLLASGIYMEGFSIEDNGE